MSELLCKKNYVTCYECSNLNGRRKIESLNLDELFFLLDQKPNFSYEKKKRVIYRTKCRVGYLFLMSLVCYW
jgi:hypothetical protein